MGEGDPSTSTRTCIYRKFGIMGVKLDDLTKKKPTIERIIRRYEFYTYMCTCKLTYPAFFFQ